jgi:hypothetical protein
MSAEKYATAGRLHVPEHLKVLVVPEASDPIEDRLTPLAAEHKEPRRVLHLEAPPPSVRREGWGATGPAHNSSVKRLVVGVEKAAEHAAEKAAGTVVVAAGNVAAAPLRGCASGRACLLRVCARKVRGFELPAFLSLLASLVLPSMDAASDWAVTLSWYPGDMGWFTAGLTIQLFGGIISGAMLAWMLREGENDIGGASITRTTRGGNMHACLAVPLGLTLGLVGLAPAAMGLLALWSADPHALNFLKIFKVLELVFEALPQLVLQTYVGVAFGLLDPSGDEFDVLLACSVGVALLGSGASCLSFEALGRYNIQSEEALVTVGSIYGVSTMLMRAAQTASLVLSVAMLGCAFKEAAALGAVLTVALYVGMGLEAMTRDQDRELQKCCAGIEACGGSCASLCGISGYMSRRGAVVWGALHALLVGGMVAAFFEFEHVDNNYNDAALPATGNTSAPQHYDCHDRTSALYPAALACTVSVVMLPLSLLVDPKYGWRCGKKHAPDFALPVSRGNQTFAQTGSGQTKQGTEQTTPRCELQVMPLPKLGRTPPRCGAGDGRRLGALEAGSPVGQEDHAYLEMGVDGSEWCQCIRPRTSFEWRGNHASRVCRWRAPLRVVSGRGAAPAPR